MGWLISWDMTKKEQVAELVAGWDKDGKGCEFIAHSVRGNVLFAVGQPFDNRGRFVEDRWILVCLLRKDRGQGWGYKDMSEGMGPFKYDCPLKFLDMVPTVKCEKWRESVRTFHETRKNRSSRTIEPGTVFTFAPGYKDSIGESLNGETATILRKSGRGYIAELENMTIKVMRRHIGEIQVA